MASPTGSVFHILPRRKYFIVRHSSTSRFGSELCCISRTLIHVGPTITIEAITDPASMGCIIGRLLSVFLAFRDPFQFASELKLTASLHKDVQPECNKSSGNRVSSKARRESISCGMVVNIRTYTSLNCYRCLLMTEIVCARLQ